VSGWLLNVPDVPLEEIVEWVKAHRKSCFILLTGLGYTRSLPGRKDDGMPFDYPDPALVKFEILDATDPDKEKTAARTRQPGCTCRMCAVHLLHLKGRSL